jgi:uncharacterized protein
MTPAETVQAMYQAFGQGDIQAILGRLADDVAWEYGGAPSTDIPWLQPRNGRDAVAGFFQSLHALEFHSFVPTRILSDGNVVVALVDLEATFKETGRRVKEIDEAHIWYFNHVGQVQRFRHRVDTHLQYLATRT